MARPAGGIVCGNESYRTLCSQAATVFDRLANLIRDKSRGRLNAPSVPTKQKRQYRNGTVFLLARPAGGIFLRKCASARLMLASRHAVALHPNLIHGKTVRQVESTPRRKNKKDRENLSFLFWRARQDSNLRPTGS